MLLFFINFAKSKSEKRDIMKRFLRKDKDKASPSPLPNVNSSAASTPRSTPATSSSRPASTSTTPASSTTTTVRAPTQPKAAVTPDVGAAGDGRANGGVDGKTRPAAKASSVGAGDAAAGVECDVVVVGGGLSGLSAAAEVAQRDPTLRVAVLEAREDRLGGRIRTVKADVGAGCSPVGMDLGGQLISSSHKPVMELLDLLKLSSCRLPLDGGRDGLFCGSGSFLFERFSSSLARGGLRACLKSMDVAGAVRKIRALADTVDLRFPYKNQKMAESLDKMTLRSYLRSITSYESTVDLLELRFRVFLGGHDPSAVSVLFSLLCVASNRESFFSGCGIEVDDDSGHFSLCVDGGAQQICDRLADRLRSGDKAGVAVVRGQRVESVAEEEKEEEGAIVVTAVDQTCLRRERWRCRKVVYAAPPHTLVRVRFHPPLPPALRHVAQAMSPGEIAKFAIAFPAPLWRRQGLSGRILCARGKQVLPECGGLPINVCFDATDYTAAACKGDDWKAQDQWPAGKVAVLAGYLTCEKSLQWSQVDAATLKHTILDTLSEICGGASWPHEAIHFEFMNWSDDWQFGGGGCAPRLGALRHWHVLRRPHGHLHLAGAETAVRDMCTMSGAVRSGRRAALQVLAALRPRALSTADYAVLEACAVDDKEELQALSDAAAASVVERWIYRWTLIFPMCGLVFGYAAYAFRDKYASLFVPFHH